MSFKYDTAARDETRFQEFLYARGYLLVYGQAIPPKPDWRSVALGSLTLSYDPIQPFALAVAPQGSWQLRPEPPSWIAILGRVLDLQDCSIGNATVAEKAARALGRSEDALFDLIDWWNGRFLLVYGLGGKTRVMTDSCAARSAYYSFKGGVTIASHARIAAERTGAGSCPKMAECAKDPRWEGSVGQFPGNVTPFTDVYVLTPNTLIDVEDRKIRRFFPRAPLDRVSTEQAAGIAGPLLRSTALAWAKAYPLEVSLTAGIDSRLTLSALKDGRDKIGVFTYVAAGTETHETDAAVAQEIASSLDLNYKKLDLVKGKGPAWEAFRQAHSQNVYTTHRVDAAWAYLNAFLPGTIHIRSNAGEIARAFYRKSGRVDSRPCTPKCVADVFKPKRMGDNAFVVESFERFFDVAQFELVANYDPWDMLYWEQRMSSWHSSLMLEADPACDTLVLFNSRAVLAPLLSVPVDDRVKSLTFYRIIEMLWPELLSWKVNCRSVPKELERSRPIRLGCE
ncbi:MAG TPA: hypothetical protein VNO69_03005 [Methyloceanibacter sp.]|nr:hypothetical protein [Methyloceanibacter sp.]